MTDSPENLHNGLLSAEKGESKREKIGVRSCGIACGDD